MDNTAKNKVYTYWDYKSYSENERIEIIDGHLYDMAPAPSRVHQDIISQIITILNNYISLKRGECKVYPAPFDVMLTEDSNIENCKNIVQPDISVICDKTKLNDRGCIGAPDLIIEVISPFNPSNDYVRKLHLYEQFKIKEYWIINPIKENIFVYRLDDNMEYSAPEVYSFKDKIKVGIYDDLDIDFSYLNLK